VGVRERRNREHEATRNAILVAAREIFLREGYANASIRRIAEKIEYSPAAIYRYFKSKEDIFFVIAEAGFSLFNKAMDSVEPADDPVETLRRRLWRYYEFSKAQPEYFALMFVDRSVPRITRDWERLAFMRPTRDKLSEVVRRCVESGALPPGLDPDGVFHVLATAMYGASLIRLSDRFVPRQDADALARDVLETMLAGLRHGVRLSFAADVCFHSTRGPRAPNVTARTAAKRQRP
jgi:AcrR family transcriptional regulator